MPWWKPNEKPNEYPAFQQALERIAAARDLPSLTDATGRFNEVAATQPIPAEDLNVQRVAAYMLAVDAAVRDDTLSEEESELLRPMLSQVELTAGVSGERAMSSARCGGSASGPERRKARRGGPSLASGRGCRGFSRLRGSLLVRRADLDVSILQIADPLWPCSGAATGVRTPHHPVGGFKEAGWARVAGWRGVPS